MIDISYLPVSDPVKFFAFVVLPGFLIFYTIKARLHTKTLKKKYMPKFIRETHVFGGVWDTLLACILIGILISCILNTITWNAEGEWHRFSVYKQVWVGIFSSMIAIVFFLFVATGFAQKKIEGRFEGNERRMWHTIIFIVRVGFPVIFLIIVVPYLSTPNPIIRVQGPVYTYHTISCNENLGRIKVINPFDYPLHVYVKRKNIKKEIYQEVNNSLVQIGYDIVVESKQLKKFVVKEDYEENKQGYIHLFINSECYPLRYYCPK